MKKYLAALVLVLCLILAACDGREERQNQPSVLGEVSGLDEETILLTIDGREVPAWRYLYWLAYTCERIEERYEDSGLLLDWETPVSGGTLADYAKDQALADTALYATVENWAEKYGCVVTEEEVQDTTSCLPDMGLSSNQMWELERVGRMYAKLYALYCTEGSSLAPTKEALAAFGEEQGAVALDRILIPFGEDREAAQKKAAEAFSQINSAEDQAAAFSALAAENADTMGARTVLPEDGQLNGELLEAVKALQEGQCSGILESEEGFSILRRLPLDTETVKETYFDSLLQTDAENSAVTTGPEYASLDPSAFTAAAEWDEDGK